MKPLDLTTELPSFLSVLKAYPDFVIAYYSGGSAIHESCIDKIQLYYVDSNVQIGGSRFGIMYSSSSRSCTGNLNAVECRECGWDLLCWFYDSESLPRADRPIFNSDDEIIVMDTDHEGISLGFVLIVANIGL